MANEFTAILGNFGSGKSNLLCWMMYEYHLQGMPIYTDMTVNFPHTKIDFDWFSTFMDDDTLEGICIGIDEMSEGFDSYDFLNPRTKKGSRAISQIRKTLSICIYTEQRFSKIPKRMRDITSRFIFCTDLDANKPHHDYFNCDSLFQLDMVDQELHFINQVVFNGKPVQHLYNSRERIRDTKKEKNVKSTIAV